ncbi:Flagellar hook-associated protein 2 [Caulifigura coniformis]|uniref:Flagellar hook-associated protein 2 n=1 Tax=Caulifigura coniformis TaxID=2527983 RepID=A0A517SCH4_9PLAN|nr:flagellar filament capping protein FliD [Caulifigura coniformis]QDT53796.1 Flagellar hook-associated protein 2 [Caulifigura coniformis]
MPTISGLATGIDTDSIVQELLKIRQTRIDVLTAQKKEVTDQQAAFKLIEADIISLRGQATTLSRSLNNVFDARKVTSSNEDALVATATSRAATGVYQVRVNSLAQAHQIASQGFASEDAEITQGTFELKAGSSSSATITIDSTNNTLQGLADSINGAGIGISATIVQDASNPGTPFKLLLTSSKTGVANQITLTNSLGASGGNAVQPTFDFNNPVQAAADSVVQLGTGTGAVTSTSATNTISNLINGVTLNLKQADATKTYSITVTRDTEAATESVQKFVDSYNSLMDEFATQFRYSSENNEAGLLLGNSTAQSLQQSVRESVLGTVAGVNGKANRLSAIGVTVTNDGKLEFDATKLGKVFAGEMPGVTANDVKRLFALDGVSSNGGIEFMLGSSKTAAPANGIQVDITQAAERAAVTATNSIGTSIVIDGTNDTLAAKLDGRTATDITITHGTYTRAELASALEAALNSHEAFSGRIASVGLAGDKLTIQSDAYGSVSQVAMTGGTAAAALGFSGAETSTGKDVAGTFIIDGQEELATGNGRLLQARSGNANTDGLQIRVSLTTSQVVSGVDGTITITHGVGARLDQTLGKMLDATTGRIKIVNDGFDDKLKALQTAIDRQNDFFDQQEKKLNDQFIALETTISALQTTATYLSAQLAGINGE